MALQLFEIADTVVSSPVATVTFTNIPQGYTDLKLMASVRTNTAANFQLLRFSLNGSEGSFKEFYSTNVTVGQGTAAQNRLGYSCAASNTENTFSNGELYIPNYTGSSVKTSWADMVSENAGSVSVLAFTVNATTTSAVTSMTFFLESGFFVTNSTFTLYGVL